MAQIKAGMEAPDFSLQDGNGTMHTLSNYRGKRVILFFYPKDNTSGCTLEAEEFRDAYAEYTKQKTVVFGISADSVASHKKFGEKLMLPFHLLADVDKKVVNLYGVWGKKKMMGREYMGMKRMSFLIGEDGNVLQVYETVKPKLHAGEVVLELKKKK